MINLIELGFTVMEDTREPKLFKQETDGTPVTEDESYDVTIEDLAGEGGGVARIEGFVILVPGTKVGDNVKIKVETVMRRFTIVAVED